MKPYTLRHYLELFSSYVNQDQPMLLDIITPNDINTRWIRQNPSAFSLTDNESREIMAIMQDNYDANIGYNWDVIDCAIEEWQSRNKSGQGNTKI